MFSRVKDVFVGVAFGVENYVAKTSWKMHRVRVVQKDTSLLISSTRIWEKNKFQPLNQNGSMGIIDFDN